MDSMARSYGGALPELSRRMNPELSAEFAAFMRERAGEGIYRREVLVGDRAVPLDIYPTVFPSEPRFSESVTSLFRFFTDARDMEVADVGSGSGIQSIAAAIGGARHVDAADINPRAVECSRHNVEMNGLCGTVDVFHSDLFGSFPRKRYDLIIGNLPIVDFDEGDDAVSLALYDPGFAIHRRLFTEARDFLADTGVMIFTHANLQSAGTTDPSEDFRRLESLLEEYGYSVVERESQERLGVTWINYKVRLI